MPRPFNYLPPDEQELLLRCDTQIARMVTSRHPPFLANNL